MPQLTSIIRRRRKRRQTALPTSARVGALLLVILPVALGALSLSISRLYLELTQQVPAVEDIEAFFEEDGLQPSVVVARDGVVLQSLLNPPAAERQWVSLAQDSAIVAPDLLVRALLLEQDPTFWDNPGYLPSQTGAALVASIFGRGQATRDLTITERVIEATLLPLEEYPYGSLRRNFRTALLAERLNARYDKRTILEWYLNSVHFGHHIYGVDSASLAYFGKHVDGLTLGEMAVLAAVPSLGEQVMQSPTAIRSGQRQVLSALQAAGEISSRQARAARAQPLSYRNLAELADFPNSAAIRLALEQAEEAYGSEVHNRGGLTFVTTLDPNLQEQANCLLSTQLARLTGASANTNVPTESGSPCLASGLLPPIRPSDVGVDREVQSGALVVVDPALGELRAYAAQSSGGEPAEALAGHQADELVQPFIYLTAFSRGFSPGSMVLDLPASGEGLIGEAIDKPLSEFKGPLQMRQALRSGSLAAAAQTTELAGQESVERTLLEFGLVPMAQSITPNQLVAGEMEISPLSMTAAYAVLANEGVMVGKGNGTLNPIVLDRIDDRFGRPHMAQERQRRAIVSQGLAYLVTDVLRDQGQLNPQGSRTISLGIDQPAASASTFEIGGAGSWTVGYTPGATISAWYGNPSGQPTTGLAAQNSSAPTVAAMLRYATRDSDMVDWLQPAEVNDVEVCTPSGLLPTSYCPQVVDELFLQGTEPTSFDNLYQPFRLNRETGNLATLATPLELIEERVYLVPPPEASAWARAVGLEQPPTEYDPLPAVDSGDEEVNIELPEPFAVLRGEVEIRGDAHPVDFDFYRVQVGAGLNPTRWIQIGEDRERRVWGSTLAQWDTEALSGLYTLQLVVVQQDGTIRTASVPVTIDNLAPEVRLIEPSGQNEFSSSDEILIEAAVEEGLGVQYLEISVDGRVEARLNEPPYVYTLSGLEPGQYSVSLEAVDLAGNSSPPAKITLRVIP